MIFFEKRISAAASLLLILASFANGYLARGFLVAGGAMESVEQDNWLEQDLLEHFDFVNDALGRWALENEMTTAEALKRWTPQAMPFDDRVCVQFVLRRLATGGAPPVYCYRLDSDGWDLIYERAQRH